MPYINFCEISSAGASGERREI